MEIIYAILIFFGAMTPGENNTTFNQAAYQQTIVSQETLIQTISSDAVLLERIRTMDIDRLED